MNCVHDHLIYMNSISQRVVFNQNQCNCSGQSQTEVNNVMSQSELKANACNQ